MALILSTQKIMCRCQINFIHLVLLSFVKSKPVQTKTPIILFEKFKEQLVLRLQVFVILVMVINIYDVLLYFFVIK